MKLHEYINDNFPNLPIGAALFYRGAIGIRFQLGPDSPKPFEQDTGIYNEEYFNETIKRACTIYKEIFDDNDNIIFVLQEYCWKKHRIRKYNYCFRQISNLDHSKIKYKKVYRLYDDEKEDKWNRAIINIKAKDLNHKNIITAISNQDFHSRTPITHSDLYIFNIDKHIIYSMYDDRGLDIIAKDKNSIQHLYDNYEEWILDYDKKDIDQVFKETLTQTT